MQNVNFKRLALVALDGLDRAERAMLDQLTEYQLVGPSGWKLEWLEGIESGKVVKIAFATLSVSDMSFKWMLASD